MYCIPDSPGSPPSSPGHYPEGDDFSDSEDDKSQMISETRTLKSQVSNLLEMFPDRRIAPPTSSYVSHTSRFDATQKIASNLDLLAGTWLAKPPVHNLEEDSQNWSSLDHQKRLPHIKYDQNAIPRALWKEHGPPPLDLPFEYEDPRIRDFFDSPSWLRSSDTISLPPCFDSRSTGANKGIKDLALSEILHRRSLKTAHGLYDLNAAFFEQIRLLREQGVAPSPHDWADELHKISDLLFSNLLAFRRIVSNASSGVMVAKKLARVQVLAKFKGNDDLVKSLLYSDFGTADLFGSLDPLMQGRVNLFHAQGKDEWLLRSSSFSKGGKRRPRSAPSPAPKKPATSTPSSSFVVPESTSGLKKQPITQHIFTPARGRGGKKGRKSKGKRGG